MLAGIFCTDAGFTAVIKLLVKYSNSFGLSCAVFFGEAHVADIAKDQV